MMIEKFERFWNLYSNEWIDNATLKENGSIHSVSEYCTIKPNCVHELYDTYCEIKRILKKRYYAGINPLLNRYRRAAALAYAINEYAPLEYLNKNESPEHKFLVQRLAFYIALSSIIIEYPQKAVETLQQQLFVFPKRDSYEEELNADDFLTSVYKDLYLAKEYKNFNVLTLSNVLWLIVANSPLGSISPLSPPNKK